MCAPGKGVPPWRLKSSTGPTGATDNLKVVPPDVGAGLPPPYKECQIGDMTGIGDYGSII